MVIQEIKTVLSAVGMDSFSVNMKDYSDKTFGNYVAELTDGDDKIRIIRDRGQVFMQLWDSHKGSFVNSTDIYPEMSEVYTIGLNEVGVGDWSLEDILRSYLLYSQK